MEGVALEWLLTCSPMIYTVYAQELSEARALLLRLRKRDLFAMVGEVLLSHRDYEGLLSNRHDGVMTSTIIRDEVHALIKASYPDFLISGNDLFCEIIKMNYGKGILNPVDGPTAFYRPKASSDDDGDDTDLVNEDHDDVYDPAAAIGAFRSMAEQEHYWSVGVVPQGNTSNTRKSNS